MPELPEVETVKRVVEPQIIGKGKDYRSAPLLKVYGHGWPTDSYYPVNWKYLF